MSSSKEVLSKWSRPMNVGPVDFPTEFRLVTAPPGSAPQYAQLGRSSNHFGMASLPRRGMHPSIKWVPNFQRVAEITNNLQQQSQHLTEFGSYQNGTTHDDESGEIFSKSCLMSVSSPDTRWNQLLNSAPQPRSIPSVLFKKGDRVLARYHGGAEFWKARVDKVILHDSGAIWFDVIYDSRSEGERGLPSYFLNPDPDAAALKKGEKVKVRYRGRTSWHLAEVVRLSPSQPWMGPQFAKTETQDDCTVTSRDTRTMPGVGTDKVHLTQDYLLYDDHRSHHLSNGEGLVIVNEDSLPQDYDPDLLLYDVRYCGGRTELAVPRHLIRREPDKKKAAANPLMGTSVHEELGFLLRQRLNTTRLEGLKNTCPQEEEESSELLTIGTATIRDSTKQAAQNATDLRHQLVPNSEAAISDQVFDQLGSVSGARSTETMLDSFENSEEKERDWSVALSRPSTTEYDFHSVASRRVPISSRLRSSDDDMEGYAEDTGYLYERDGLALRSQNSPTSPLHLSGNPVLVARTLAVDHAPPKLTMQERLAQQGHDRTILRSIGARQADPDGVAVPANFKSTVVTKRPVKIGKKLLNRRPAETVEDEMSLAGWSGDTGFVSVSSFGQTRRGVSSAYSSEKPKKSHLSRKPSRRTSSISFSSQRRSELVSRGEVLGTASPPSAIKSNNEDTQPASSLLENFTIKDPIASRVLAASGLI